MRHHRAGSEVTWASGLSTASVSGQGGQHPDGKVGQGGKEEKEDEGVKRKTSLWAKVRKLLLFRKKEGTVDGDEEPGVQEDDAQKRMTHLDPTKDTTDPTPFEHNPSQLAVLLDPKSLEGLEALGGIEGVLHGLGTDGLRGLNIEGEGKVEIDGMDRGNLESGSSQGIQYHTGMKDRQRVYGENLLPKKKSKSFLQLCWMAFQDKMLVSLHFRFPSRLEPLF